MGYIPVFFVLLITVATLAVGFLATRQSRTAGDFFVAGRAVSVFWNASAISGEYLSAASFLGVAGLIMKNGYDALWYPVCYAAGYLFLLLFIAGPLRRFGAYTIPDFAEGRFDSPAFRKIAVIFVLLIGFFYTMPQMKGAGITMAAILHWPYWAGILVVGTVITFNVALGGMKGITLVQAFQYWAKLLAISLPVFILLAVFGRYSGKIGTALDNPKNAPRFNRETTLELKGKVAYPANVINFSSAGTTEVAFPKGFALDKVTAVRKPEAGEDVFPTEWLRTAGGEAVTSHFKTSGASSLLAEPRPVTQSGMPISKDGKPVVTAPKIEFDTPTTAVFRENDSVPNAQANKKWVEPFGTMTSKYGFPLLYTYSLIIALVCGTAGLPHILVRFYTNPDGRAAKRTTFWVMVLLGVFYIFTPIWGALGRAMVPELYANNTTDSAVIKLPTLLQNPLLAQILTGIISAGAFAAFMSTFSGLLVSMSGAFAHDIYGKILKPNASAEARLTAFKLAAVVFGIVSMLLGYLVETFDIATMVGWAFAIGAASYFPLLLLGSWWRGLTMRGAASGMLIGGMASLTAIVTSMLLDKKIFTFDVSPILRTLMEQPAIWGVPLSLSLMYAVSKATAKQIPANIDEKMLRLHAPEEMGLSKDYIS